MAPKFAEHVVFATVKDSAPAGMLEELSKAAKKYERTEGVLSLNVGSAEPVFGNSSFVSHIRGANDAALDSVITKFHTDPIVGPNLITEHFGQRLALRFQAQPVGSAQPNFPCFRFGLLKYKAGITPKEINEAKEVFHSLPSKFPQIKQVNIGENYPAPQDGMTPDQGYDLGLVIGFSSVEDLKVLTSESNSEYMATMMSTLPKFEQVKVSNMVNCG
ncbi:unnamed protein product [Calypogeia fissa]